MANVALFLDRKIKERGRMMKKVVSMDHLKEKLSKRIENITKDIDVLQKAIDLTKSKKVKHIAKPKEGSKIQIVKKDAVPPKELTPQDAIVKLLSDRKVKMSASEILKGLLDRGWKTKSDKPANIIYTSLNRLVEKKVIKRSKRGKIVVFYTW